MGATKEKIRKVIQNHYRLKRKVTDEEVKAKVENLIRKDKAQCLDYSSSFLLAKIKRFI